MAIAFAHCFVGGKRADASVAFPVSINDPGNQYIAFHPHVRLAVQKAGALWAEVFECPVPVAIEVEVTLGANVARATGASATSSFLWNDGVRDIWEQGAAAEIRTGIDPNGAEPDILIEVGPNYLQNEMWFDPVPNQRLVPVPPTQTDAISVFLHELGHAIVFNGWIDWATGLRPATYQSYFDTLTESPTGAYRFAGPRAVHLYRANLPLTSGNIYHLGNLEGQVGDDLIPDVMNGVAFYRGTRYELSAHTMAVAEDLDLPVALSWPRWSQLAFRQFQSTQTLVAQADDDWDGDTNLLEFVLGTDPFDPVSRAAYSTTPIPVNQAYSMRLGFPLIRSVRGFDIHIDASRSLGDPFVSQATFRPQDANAPLQMTHFTSGQAQARDWFTRLRVAAASPGVPLELQGIAAPRGPRRLITGPTPIRRECPACLSHATGAHR